MISKTESGWVGYRKKYRVAGRVRVPAGHWCLMLVMMTVRILMISLTVVPTRVTAALANRIREEEEREGVVQEVISFIYIVTFVVLQVLQMARIEHAFLTAKECVGFFNESLSREKMELARQQKKK